MKSIYYEPVKYENSITFEFLSQKTLFTNKTYKVSDVKEWFEKCMSYGLSDVKLLTPLAVKDRKLLAFSNTTQNSLVSFYKNGKVTYFTAQWLFNNTLNQWDITYTEHLWENAPDGKPSFDDNEKLL